jgi:YtkA-like
MRQKTIIVTLAISIAAIIVAACGGRGSDSGPSANEKVIKSTTAGDMTVTLASDTGELKNGENDLVLSFTDSTSKTVDVGAASLKFHMPAMGSMAEMNDEATLTTTNAPGKYRAKVNIEMAGTWEAIINYQGPKGTGQARMTVNAK